LVTQLTELGRSRRVGGIPELHPELLGIEGRVVATALNADRGQISREGARLHVTYHHVLG
jgi:hypothetical protein